MKASTLKSCLRYHILFSWIIVTFKCVMVNAQNDTIIGNRSAAGILEMECISKDYGFIIDNYYYSNGDNIFLCYGSEILLTVVDSEYKMPITGNPTFAENITFSDNALPDHLMPASARVYATSMQNGQAKVEVAFIVNGKVERMKITLRYINEKNIAVDRIKTHPIALRAFDENKFPKYPNSDSGLPSKFILAQGDDKVKLNSDLSKKKKDQIINTVSLYDLLPNHLNYSISGDELNLYHIHGESQNSFTVKACSNPGIELMEVDIYPQKRLTVEIYTLCESDDDVINYCIDKPWLMLDCNTPITSNTHECILPGEDGTLDRYLDHTFWKQKDNDPNKPSDVLDYTNEKPHELKIRPSYDNATGRYFCNKRPQPANTAPCPNLMTLAELSALQSDMNTIYNQAGITVEIVDKGYKYFNFDLSTSEDNSLSYQEQLRLHWAFIGYMGPFGLEMQKSDNTIIWRVNDIPGSAGAVINGKATNFGINSVAINVTNGTPTFRTIPHEIGHARYELRHPDENWVPDKLKGPVNNDKYNIMNSGPIFQNNPLESISDFRIRRYQWEKIQVEH